MRINHIGPRGAECFPSIDASDDDCQRFAVAVIRALPEAILARLFCRQGALLSITKFADDVVIAEAYSIVSEPWMIEQLWQKPGPGEIAVVLALAEVPSNHAGDYNQVSFWQGMVTPKHSSHPVQ